MPQRVRTVRLRQPFADRDECDVGVSRQVLTRRSIAVSSMLSKTASTAALTRSCACLISSTSDSEIDMPARDVRCQKKLSCASSSSAASAASEELVVRSHQGSFIFPSPFATKSVWRIKSCPTRAPGRRSSATAGTLRSAGRRCCAATRAARGAPRTRRRAPLPRRPRHEMAGMASAGHAVPAGPRPPAVGVLEVLVLAVGGRARRDLIARRDAHLVALPVVGMKAGPAVPKGSSSDRCRR